MNSFARLAIFTPVLGAFSLSARAADVPQGSYLQTCVNVQLGQGSLYATCQDTSGHYRNSVLPEYRECVGDISNNNGDLRCDRREGRDWDSNRQGWVPPGSYVETCRGIRFDDNTLTAKCQTMNGRWVRTTLRDRQQCVGGIVNDDGQLQCGRRTFAAHGSFLQTCAPVYVRGDFLRARCQTVNGGWVWSSLNDFDDCHGDIANQNGQLRCMARGDRDEAYRDHDHDGDRDRDGDHDRDRDRDRDRVRPAPNGSYAQTCRDIHMQGDRLNATCETVNRRWISTSLDDVYRCRGDISNNNGQLTCSR
jgi:hypothetical protein